MRKIMAFAAVLLVLSISAMAGNLDVDDPTFEDGDNEYNGSAIIDADTLQGMNTSDITEGVQTDVDDLRSFVESSREAWAKDIVGGGGISVKGLAKYLMGYTDFFTIYESFIDYINENFVRRSVYEADVAKLNARIDALEARSLGTDLDSYQKAMALKYGSHGSWACSDEACIKTVG